MALVDLDLEVRVADLVFPEAVKVAGLAIDRIHPGNAPDRFFLADRRHAGTVAQALIARRFIEAVNDHFGAGIPP